MASVTEQATQLYEKASSQWGAFRRFLSMHPLSMFYAALGAGVLIGIAVKALKLI